MHRYVDGFVIPVAEANLAAYRRMARRAGKVWMEHGALDFVECAGDDTPFGKRTSFPRSVKLKDGETVIFSWIVYPSRAIPKPIEPGARPGGGRSPGSRAASVC